MPVIVRDDLALRTKDRYGSFDLWINVGWQIKLCDPLLKRAQPKRLRDEQPIIIPTTTGSG